MEATANIKSYHGIWPTYADGTHVGYTAHNATPGTVVTGYWAFTPDGDRLKGRFETRDAAEWAAIEWAQDENDRTGRFC